MTTTDATVRTWCREQGIEVPERGKLNARFHEQYRDAHPDEVDDDQDDEQLLDDAGEQTPALRLVDEQQLDDTGETPPRISRPKKGPMSLFRRATAAGKAKGGSRRRVSLESTLSAGWAILASAAAQAGQGPTSRVLAMQAPVAGVILEDSLKGTVADRVLQPIARATATGSKVGALLGPPVLVSLLDRQPHLAPQVLPLLRLALREWVMTAGPAMKAAQKKKERAMEALGLDEGTSLDAMIEDMIQGIFDPPEFEDEQAQRAAA